MEPPVAALQVAVPALEEEERLATMPVDRAELFHLADHDVVVAGEVLVAQLAVGLCCKNREA